MKTSRMVCGFVGGEAHVTPKCIEHRAMLNLMGPKTCVMVREFRLGTTWGSQVGRRYFDNNHFHNNQQAVHANCQETKTYLSASYITRRDYARLYIWQTAWFIVNIDVPSQSAIKSAYNRVLLRRNISVFPSLLA